MADPKLSTYELMRDFNVTPEPSGRIPVAASDRPRFVVQKHAATRLHYDFRLEYEGVFLSWAVTRGPSLDPDDKRLAVETEPHPLDYGDFEGTIPKGQYGGGTVMLWDRGYWTPDPTYSVEAGLKKGHLQFTLQGDRMQGGWHLVRIRNDRSKSSKRGSWLLFKSHDAFADPEHADGLISQATSIASGRTMEDIAAGLGKGPRPFMIKPARRVSARAVWNSNEAELRDAPATTVVKASRPKKSSPKATPMPGFIPPQLAKGVDRPPAATGWAHEVKFDGYRLQLHVHEERAVIYSRNGLDWTHRFPEIAAAAARLPDCIVDTETVALNSGGSPDFAALQAALSSGKTEALVAFSFDLLWVEGQDLRSLPLRERKDRLQQVLETPASEGASPLRFVEHFETAGDAVLQSACRMDLEGVVSKHLDAPYLSGRSETWTKAKCRAGQEVVIGGWTGTENTLRSLLVGVFEGDRLAYAGRVGTGFNRESAAALARRLAALESPASPFSGAGAPRKASDVRWARPELVAEIEFAGWTGGGAVRQASFKGLREDKSANEVFREGLPDEAADPAVRSQQGVASPSSAARGSPAKHRSSMEPVSFRRVGISNPDKPLWPAFGSAREVTKADLASYIDAIGERMLPHVRGRPLSLVRTPDGIEGAQRFFQRHAMPGQSSLVRTIEIGDRKPYLAVDTVEGLIALAQTGVTEFHPSNCLPDKPEIPGRLVFDLDPAEDVPFSRVVQGAIEIRDRLAALGLVGFLKTTGGKGLHVVTPLKPKRGAALSWAEAKGFSQEVCRQAAADSPDAYVTTMAKRARTGKIFLDYLRNDRLSTAVAVLSPRARPGAPVSLPISWAEATPDLDTTRYTLRSVPALVQRSDPWDGYDAAAKPLADAIKRLSGSALKRTSAQPRTIASR